MTTQQTPDQFVNMAAEFNAKVNENKAAIKTVEALLQERAKLIGAAASFNIKPRTAKTLLAYVVDIERHGESS